MALRERRKGLAQQLPPVTEILRGSLVERYVTCGNPACKCARGERHEPVWYLTVTLGPGRTTGGIIPADKMAQVRGWIENYHAVKDRLEKIAAVNREPLRRDHEAKGIDRLRQRTGRSGTVLAFMKRQEKPARAARLDIGRPTQ